MKKYFRLLRVKHYMKNLLCLFPLFFSGGLMSGSLLLKGICGTVVFCLVSSVIYILNDIADVEKDRKHQTKCKRPIAAGELSVQHAMWISVCLAIIVMIWIVLCNVELRVWFWLLIYFIMNIFYSKIGKNIPLLDVFLLGAGYPIRIFYGGALLDIDISAWLFLTVTSIALYLGLGKRYGELRKYSDANVSETRPVLKKYTVDYLVAQMYICLGLGLVFYSMWAIERAQELAYTVPIVIAICMRYNMLINKNHDGDPIEVVLSDKSMISLIVLYGLLLVILLYGMI